MSVITIEGFLGENRAIHAKLLNDKVGTLSNNQKPGRGDLRPWKAPATVSTVPGGRNTIYRMGRDVSSDANYWLAWPAVVHAMRGFETDDTTERTYYTGDGAPKVTDNTIALSGGVYPSASRPLGVPAPTIAPAVTGTNPSPATETISKAVNTVEIANGICQVSTTTPNGFEAGNTVVISLSNGFNGTYTIMSTVSSDSFVFPASGSVALTTSPPHAPSCCQGMLCEKTPRTRTCCTCAHTAQDLTTVSSRSFPWFRCRRSRRHTQHQLA